jgi:glutathione S-transferase
VIVPKLTWVEKRLGTKEWVMGYPTVADFVLLYVMDMVTKLDPKQSKSWKSLTSHYSRVSSLPEISKFRESSRCPRSFFSSHATWGGPQ